MEAVALIEPSVLKAGDKQNVEYAIPLWLRDIQIKHALSRVSGRIEPVDEPRSDPVALVCFGPSLADTWEEIRNFKTIITCSGAHKFLTERGIIPTYHMEVDPRAHKVALIGPPNRDTEYWISSTCHKSVFDHLEGYNVKLWHVFDGNGDKGRFIPAGEDALVGGCGVGLRLFQAAAYKGFRDAHVFGMDGCEKDGKKHAAEHPNEPKKHALVEYPEGSGQWFKTTASMLEAARATAREVAQLPKVKFTFHGSGLVQEMMKDAKPVEDAGSANIVALKKPLLITPEFRALNAKLHNDNALYGAGGHKHAEMVKKLVTDTKAQSVLDYGCGKGTLGAQLPFPIWEYDPAVPGKDDLPRSADLVLCLDVLEHIEPELIANVLAHLSKLVTKVGYFVISTRPAKKTYDDGRNTHLIVRSADWWAKTLAKFFTVGTVNAKGAEVHVVVGPKATKGKEALVTVVVHDGTDAAYYTPTDVTKWRADTLLTKEPCTIAWIDTFQPGETLWDVGANVGGYSIWAAKRRGAKVYAFEPEASNYALLCKNMTLNKVEGAAYCLALHAHPTVALSTIYLSTQEPGGSCNTFGAALGPDLKERKGIPQGALGMSLDSLAAAIPAPDHLKIDVDGLEHLVIAGGAQTLDRVKSILLEVNASLPEHRIMLEGLAQRGFVFDAAQVEAATRKEGAFKGCAEYVLRRKNAVEDAVIEKINAAPIIELPFPHIYLEDVFPADFYATFAAALPGEGYKSLEEARGTKGYPERFVHDAPTSVSWMQHGRFRAALDAKFGIKSVSDEVALLQDKKGYSIPPHTDTPTKGVSALFYVTRDWTPEEHGTTLYVPLLSDYRDPVGKHQSREGFRADWTAPGKPNSVVIFARTDNSFHGAERYEGSRVRDILLYDTRK